MRQPEDRATIELPGLAPAKRGRGRPRKPDALTPAQRAKRYRDRQRAAKEQHARALAAGIRYRGPNGETWTGRGQRPRWYQAALQCGETEHTMQARAAAPWPWQYLRPHPARAGRGDT